MGRDDKTPVTDLLVVHARGAEVVLTVLPVDGSETTITLDPDYVDSLIGRLFTENRRARWAWDQNKRMAAQDGGHRSRHRVQGLLGAEDQPLPGLQLPAVAVPPGPSEAN